MYVHIQYNCVWICQFDRLRKFEDVCVANTCQAQGDLWRPFHLLESQMICLICLVNETSEMVTLSWIPSGIDSVFIPGWVIVSMRHRVSVIGAVHHLPSYHSSFTTLHNQNENGFFRLDLNHLFLKEILSHLHFYLGYVAGVWNFLEHESNMCCPIWLPVINLECLFEIEGPFSSNRRRSTNCLICWSNGHERKSEEQNTQEVWEENVAVNETS